MPKLSHEHYMEKAIEHAKNNPVWPFATVLVNKEGDVILKAINAAHISPTYHGEMVAINECAEKHPEVNLSDLTLYTTAEPCTMCSGAICWSCIDTVVYGTDIPYMNDLWDLDIQIRAHDVFSKSPHKPILVEYVLKEQCDKLFVAAKKEQDKIAEKHLNAQDRSAYHLSKLVGLKEKETPEVPPSSTLRRP